ncbi:MAG: RNA polymerase sigma factor [Patescibacteria group bacterium]
MLPYIVNFLLRWYVLRMNLSKETIQLQNVLSSAHTEFEQGLLKHARFKVSDSGTCDDLVQDTFLKTWVYMVKAGKINLMKPFLYHVLNCLIIDEYRKKKSVSLDVLIENGFEIEEDVLERTINQLDGQAAVSLIETLPVAYQKIISLRYIDDFSLSEIAVETGLTKNLVAVQSHRGLEKLRTLYEERMVAKIG